MHPLSKLTIQGFKSIRSLRDFELKQLNVLIGANGAGKSNFISFFKLLAELVEGRLQTHVTKSGGPDSLLYFGRKKTSELKANLYFGNNGYCFTLEPTMENQLMFSDEALYWDYTNQTYSVGSGHIETKVTKPPQNYKKMATYVVPSIKSWVVYHFHDTSDTALVKQPHDINDNVRLRPDGSNLAAYLFMLQQVFPDHFQRIEKSVRLVAPFFGGFHLRPIPASSGQIQLEWTERDSDYPFRGYHLSDGTLRFICLATVLLQPDKKMPATILIDEPELGLHPYALKVLASLIHKVAGEHQIIVSTQSVELVNEFQPEDLIVVDHVDQASLFKRLDAHVLQSWIEEYSLGEMWKNNVFGGRPTR